MRCSMQQPASCSPRCTAAPAQGAPLYQKLSSRRSSRILIRSLRRRGVVRAQQQQSPPPLPRRPPPGPPRFPGGPFVQPAPPGMPPPGTPYPPPSSSWDEQQQQQQPGFYPPPVETQKQEKKLSSYVNAVIAAAFVAGLGLGVYFDSEVNISPANVSSTEFIDRNTPNAEVCMANGYSASVFDMKLYVTFNPFNVYTAQPVIKSGCVLRRANVGVLEREKLITQHEVDMCKSRMNTFAYMGDLKGAPDVACVYHSEEAENQYIDNMRRNGGSMANMMGAGMPPQLPPQNGGAASPSSSSQQ
ncbi:hypothetical protein DUNSADRAFT_8239 [Dunaliella salina]|uniref:DUF3172 domain-containing protein n=1 Tax=Dunaliella salina TaxID=3046 RepID=A0ABQ7HA44_DUNSA|nr:hypothetical protein DUNSADRAFT_8239 [Dunaliella salina]|eukprot:KAF5843724.1 hypothetical protein DUNSADRAFT_8239 [Dunaliella salina]